MTSELPAFNPAEDEVLRVCPLTTDIEEPTENSERRVCADCGREVWFNTAQSHGDLDQYPILILCGGCGMTRILSDGAIIMNMGDSPFEVKSLDEQAKELFDGK